MKVMFIGKGGISILPIVNNVEEIEQEYENEEYKTINGKTLNLKGNKTLRKFTITGFFPSKKYEFLNIPFISHREYIKFFLKNREEPVRVIVITKKITVLNMLCRYNFKYNITDRAGDVPYTLSITEYIKPNEGRNIINDAYL